MEDVRRFHIGFPLEAEGWLKIALGFADAGRLVEASKTLERAQLCCPPDDVELRRRIEGIQKRLEPTVDLTSDVVGSTIESLENALEREPRQPDDYRLLSELYWRAGRREEATDAIVTALWLAPDRTELSVILAERLIDLDRRSSARKLVRLLCDSSSDTALELRICRLRRQCGLDATDRLERLVAALPQSPEARFELGLVHAEAERFRDAIAELNAAVTIRPRWIEALQLLEEAYRRSGFDWEARATRIQIEAAAIPTADLTIDLSALDDTHPEPTGLSARLQLLPVPELLQFLAQRRLSGVLRITARERGASIALLDGKVVGADLTGLATPARGELERSGLTHCRAVLAELIRWSEGRIDFITGDLIPNDPPFRYDVTFLLLETMTKLEAARPS